MKPFLKTLTFLTLFELIFLLGSELVFAKSQSLIISGVCDSNQETGFKADALAAFQAESAQGKDVDIAEKDGKWDFAGSGKTHPAITGIQIKNLIQDKAKRLAPGDTFDIYITDHGIAPDSTVLSARVCLSKAAGPHDVEDFSFSLLDLKNWVSANLPNNPVRIIGTQCFSGGLHDIAFQLDNVCTVATTGSQTESFSSEGGDSLTHAFFDAIQAKPNQMSMLEAFGSGLTADQHNQSRDRVSSMAFAESVLNERDTDIKSPSKEVMDKKVEQLLTGVYKIPSLTCAYVPSPLSAKDQITQMVQLLLPVTQTDLPDGYQRFIASSYSALTVSGPGLIKDYAAVNSSYSDLKLQWDALTSADQDQRRAEFTQKVAALQDKMSKINNYIAFLLNTSQEDAENPILVLLDKVRRFMKVATPAQKAKFMQLTQCESQPF